MYGMNGMNQTSKEISKILQRSNKNIPHLLQQNMATTPMDLLQKLLGLG